MMFERTNRRSLVSHGEISFLFFDDVSFLKRLGRLSRELFSLVTKEGFSFEELTEKRTLLLACINHSLSREEYRLKV